MGRGRAASWLVLGLTITATACHHAPPPEPTPTAGDLVRRHYDQVCEIDTGNPPAVRVGELFDTLGIGAELARVDVPPLPVDSQSRSVHWRTLDFITRYTRRGRPGRMGVWESMVDSAASGRIGSILEARARPLPGLLQATGFRTVVALSRFPVLRVAPAVACLPHMRHQEGKRPTGLPDSVATWMESRGFRPNRSYRPRFVRSESTATIRIHLDAAGKVTATDSLDGDSATVAATRAIIAQLRFDPALRNGEPVPDVLVQTFAFPERRRRPGRLPRPPTTKP